MSKLFPALCGLLYARGSNEARNDKKNRRARVRWKVVSTWRAQDSGSFLCLKNNSTGAGSRFVSCRANWDRVMTVARNVCGVLLIRIKKLTTDEFICPHGFDEIRTCRRRRRGKNAIPVQEVKLFPSCVVNSTDRRPPDTRDVCQCPHTLGKIAKAPKVGMELNQFRSWPNCHRTGQISIGRSG